MHLGTPRLVRVDTRRGTFRVYDTGGGGGGGTTLVLFHGLGATSQTFAGMVSALVAPAAAYRVIAFDCRGHGGTTFDSAEDDADLCCENLVLDALHLLAQLLPPDDEQQPVILCGHSMGGAIATRLAAASEHPFAKRCSGLIVIEAVEGIAMNALDSEQPTRRPDRFRSVEDAIAWACSAPGGPLPGAAFSASLSIPDQLKKAEGGGVVWRTDVASTRPYWRGWFEGLSGLFVGGGGGRVRWRALVLSSMDKMDGELTVGQMQGRFQLLLLPQPPLAVGGGGHFVHELMPGQTAAAISRFIAQTATTQAKTAVVGMSASEVIRAARATRG